MIRYQVINVSVAGTRVPVTDAVVTLDETRAPYATADLTVPFTEARADLLDPRTGPRVDIVLQQSFRGSRTLGDISAAIGPGDTLADLTAAWTGLELADLTALWSTVWNPGVSEFALANQTRTLNLSVRSRDVDHLAGTITVRAASDEAVLVGYALLRDTPVMPDSYDVVDAVRLVLRTVLPGATLISSAPASLVEPEAAIWTPGRGAWDYLTPLTASHGLRLWCDEHRVWYLGDPLDDGNGWPTPEPFGLSIDEFDWPFAFTLTGIGVEDSVSLDGGLWHDGVVVTYRWTPWTVDGSGTPQVAYDVAGPADARAVLAVELRDTPYPGPGEAAARLAKVEQMGRVISGTAASNFTVGPRSGTTLHTSPTNNLNGNMAAVSWSLPEGTMRVRMRDMQETI